MLKPKKNYTTLRATSTPTKTTEANFFYETYSKCKLNPPDPKRPHQKRKKKYPKGHKRIFQKISKYGRKKCRNYNNTQPIHSHRNSSDKGQYQS